MVSQMQLNLNRLLLGILLFVSQSTYAVIGNNTFSMATLEQIPYGFKTSKGQIKGGLFDTMNAIISESGLKASNQLLPPQRLMFELDTGDQLCTLIANTPDTSKHFDLIEPIGISLPAGILPRKGLKLPNYASLKNTIIAVPLGVYFNKQFDRDNALTKIRPLNYSNAIQMLKYKQVDAVAGAIESLRYIAKHGSQLDSDFAPPLILSKLKIYLTCNRSTPDTVRDAMRAAIMTLKKSGKIQKIHQRYSSPKK
jgi:ABC-type amino acid transport substrate-binding protein